MPDLHFTREHEWIRVENGVGVIGISDFAQQQLGDVVFIELPPIGSSVTQGVQAAVVESVKTASEVFAPASGEAVDVNTALEGDPGCVNSDPLGTGWFFKIRLTAADELKS